MALRHLRKPDVPQVFWSDAICINQEDLVERSAEVSRMGEIYSNASRTAIFLGPASGNSVLAMEALELIGLDVTFLLDTHKLKVKKDSNVSKLQVDVEMMIAKMAQWRAIQDLLYRDWFARLWIIQEVRKSKNAILQVGFSSMSWNNFRSAVWWTVQALATSGDETLSTVLDVEHLEKHVEGVIQLSTNRITVIHYLELTKYALCSEPKDRSVLCVVVSQFNDLLRRCHHRTFVLTAYV
jgi:hypothetical protein